MFINVSSLQIARTRTPKPITPNGELVFGENMTDHMLVVEWTSSKGWDSPKITPYQNFSLDPATGVLQYGFHAFEGMKVFKDEKGKIRLFRPEKNLERMNKSCARMSLPSFDEESVAELLKKFVKLEERFIPSERGFSLYVRPNMIGTQRSLSVGPPNSALLYVIAFPVRPFPSRAIHLEAVEHALRTSPGGAASKKHSPNLAPVVAPAGLQQTLFLFSDIEPVAGKIVQYINEAGTMDLFCTMNIFFALKTKSGQKELVTAPTGSIILEGLMRLCVLELARERLQPQGWCVSERKYTIEELAEAAHEQRVLEVFGTSTAAVIVPIKSIGHRGGLIKCGPREVEEMGPVGRQMRGWIESIQYGDENHPWRYVCRSESGRA
ncbi:aminotransferase [Xylaria cubensis]|nr:aminotransferase [Xylaria cubensis]